MNEQVLEKWVKDFVQPLLEENGTETQYINFLESLANINFSDLSGNLQNIVAEILVTAILLNNAQFNLKLDEIINDFSTCTNIIINYLYLRTKFSEKPAELDSFVDNITYKFNDVFPEVVTYFILTNDHDILLNSIKFTRKEIETIIGFGLFVSEIDRDFAKDLLLFYSTSHNMTLVTMALQQISLLHHGSIIPPKLVITLLMLVDQVPKMALIDIINGMRDEFFEQYAEFLDSIKDPLMYYPIKSILAKHIPQLIQYPKIISQALEDSDYIFNDKDINAIKELPRGAIDDDLLIKCKCPDEVLILLLKNVEAHVPSVEHYLILLNQPPEYFIHYFKHLEITEKNQETYNNNEMYEILLRYDNMVHEINKSKLKALDLQKMTIYIMENKITQLDLFFELVEPGFIYADQMTLYFSLHESEIKATPENLARALTASSLHEMFHSDTFKSIYHTLVQFYYIRQCSAQKIDTNFEKINISDLGAEAMFVFNELHEIFLRPNDPIIFDLIRNLSPASKRIFYAGQVLNTNFDGELEWRYSSLNAIVMTLLLASSTITLPYKGMNENRLWLAFLTVKPEAYVGVVPLPFYNAALCHIVNVYVSQCNRPVDQHLTIHLMLSYTTNIFLKNSINLPAFMLKFVIKELELLRLNTPIALALHSIIESRLEEYGFILLHDMAVHAKYMEDESLFEVLDLSVFPAKHILRLLAEDAERDNVFSFFLARAISKLIETPSNIYWQLAAAVKEGYAQSIVNMGRHLSFWKNANAMRIILQEPSVPSIAVLALISERSSLVGRRLIETVGISVLVNHFLDVVMRYSTDDPEISRIIENAFIIASVGSCELSYDFPKRYMENPHISIPTTQVKRLLNTPADSRSFVKAVNLAYIRVSENVFMKRDWHNFPEYDPATIVFTNMLFKSLINVDNRQSIALMTMIVGTRYWMLDGVFPPTLFLNEILKQMRNLDKAEVNLNYGRSGIRYASLLDVLMRNVNTRIAFYSVIAPNIASYPPGPQIGIITVLIHHLKDQRTQFIAFAFLTQNIHRIMPVALHVSRMMSNVERRRLMIGIKLATTYESIKSRMTDYQLKMMKIILSDLPNINKYSPVDGASFSLTSSIDRELLMDVFCLKGLPFVSQLSVVPKMNYKILNNRSKHLPPVVKKLSTSVGIIEHLPVDIQIRLANKDMPELPKDLSPYKRMKLLLQSELTYRLMNAQWIHLMLPEHIAEVRTSLKIINEMPDMEVEPLKETDPTVIYCMLPQLLSIWSAYDKVDKLTEELVNILLHNNESMVIKQLSSVMSTPMILGFSSIIKHQKRGGEAIKNFLYNIFDFNAMYLVKQNSFKLIYSLISALLEIGENDEKFIGFISVMLTNSSSYTFYRGLKLLEKIQIEDKKSMLETCFLRAKSKSTELMSLVDIFPEVAVDHKDFFIQCIKELGGKDDKAAECSIYVDAIAQTFILEGTSAESLLDMDHDFWSAVLPLIDWMWDIRSGASLFLFLDKCMMILPLQKRMASVRKKIDALKDNEIGIVVNVDHENVFKESMALLHEPMMKPRFIHADILIKFPEMKTAESGGILRGWFTLVKEDMLATTDYFIATADQTCYTINPLNEDLLNFEHIGCFLALSILHKEVIGIRLPQSIIKLLLNRHLQFSDLTDANPEVSKMLMWVLDEANDPADLCLSFNTQIGDKVFELKEGGNDIELTAENRREYADLMTEFYLKKSIEKQMNALRSGFNRVIDISMFSMLTPSEFAMMMCGVPEIDPEELIANFELIPPLHHEHHVVKMFFEVIRRMSKEKLSLLLLFMTSSPIVPVGGFDQLKAQGRQPKLKLAPAIYTAVARKPLPLALTCFSHITIPEYSSVEEMEKGLTTAITESDGYK